MHCRWSPLSSLLALASLTPLAMANCLSPEDAAKHIGKTTCVAGTVTKITRGPKGVQYIDFCPQHERCGFYGVVFASDLRDVGDIRTLPGKKVELHGQIREYESQAEIIVSDARQLHGAALPPVPKQYDVEQRGRVSAGTFKAAKQPKASKRKRRVASSTIEVPSDTPQ